MAGYPHEMGHAVEVWRRTTTYPGLGDIIVLASIIVAHLDPKEKDEPRWIAQITFTVDMVDAHQNSRNSGYMYNEWFDNKETALNALMHYLFKAKSTELEIQNVKVV